MVSNICRKIFNYNYTLIYIFLTAISVTCINKLSTQIPDDVMITLSSFYAILFFHLAHFRKIKNTYNKLLKIKLLYFKLILAFLVVWGLSFIIPIYYSPALTVFFFVIWPTFLASWNEYKKNNILTNKATAFILGLLILAFYICLYYKYDFNHYIFLITALTMLGISAYSYFKLSFKIGSLGFSATEILAVRFWLLFLIPLMIMISNHHISLITSKILLYTLLLSLAVLIIPVYCSQKSLAKIGVNQHSILVGITPFAAFVIEWIFIKQNGQLHLINEIFATLLAIVIIVSKIRKLRH